MLSEQKKQQIYDEEVYRLQVRRSLQQPLASLQRLLNSAFGVWLLSAAVIITASFSFSYALAEVNASHEHQQKISQLDTEVSARLQQLLAEPPSPISLALANDQSQTLRAIFPHHNNRDLRSLLYELHALVPTEEQAEVQRALRAIERIQRSPAPARQLVLNKHRQAFDLKRWQQAISTHS